MRKFFKGLLAGTFLGTLAVVLFKPSRKPEFKDIMNTVKEMQLRKRTGKIFRVVTRSVNKMVR